MASRAKMLVPIDIKHLGESTIDWAIAVAPVLNLDIELHYASQYGEEEGMYLSALKDMAKFAESKLKKEGISVNYEKTLEADIVASILKRAAEDDIHLILQLTKQDGSWLSLLQSSTTFEVLDFAPCPVLVIPKGAKPNQGKLFKRILAPTDLMDLKPLVVTKAWAERLDATISYLHVLGKMELHLAELPLGYLTIPDEVDLKLTAQQTMIDFLEQYPDLMPHQPYAVMAAVGDSATEVAHIANQSYYDLIVTGHHHRAPFKRWLMGSVSEDILQNVKTPVLIVHSQN